MSTMSKSVRGRTIALLTAIALAAGLWLFAVGRMFPAEHIGGMQVVETSAGPRLFVNEAVSHLSTDATVDTSYTSRLAVYDVETGARVGRHIVAWMRRGYRSVTLIGRAQAQVTTEAGKQAAPPPQRVAEAATARAAGKDRDAMWAFSDASGLQLRSSVDGAVLRDSAQLLNDAQRAGLLRSGKPEDRVAWLPESRTVLRTLNTGGYVAISATTPKARAYSGPAPTPAHRSWLAAAKLGSLPGHTTVVRLGAKRLARLDHTDGDPAHSGRLRDTAARQPASGTAFLRPFFVVSTSENPIVWPAPDSMMVMHSKTLEDRSDRRLSRVRLDTGAPMWTVDLGGQARLLLARRTGRLLALVARIDGDVVLLVIDETTGKLRHRTALD